ncbi:hypothetical protein WG899_14575 [Paucibacter sp. AS339]|uniref:hypothetical protein n=1 Tax=Paucibacter hankyongi TaxID=3133434 RepID=UPI00309C377C
MNPQATIDQRKDQRVEFFLIPVQREQVPVWVFKPEQDQQGHAGVIANVSKGGLQILSIAETPLTAKHYELKLLLDEQQGIEPFTAQLRRAWSESLTALLDVNGFEYLHSDSAAAEFLNNFESFARRKIWVRCVLIPA